MIQRGRGPRHKYREICRGSIGQNRHFVASVRSDERISFGQSNHVITDDGSTDMYLAHAIAIYRENVTSLLRVIMYVALHLDENDIPEQDRAFIEQLRSISLDQQRQLVEFMQKTGYPPANFQGQPYIGYRQRETGE